jgi:phosphoglucosamine mutase
VGIAHDGDADRAMFADAEGRIIDGDQVLAACAIALAEQGKLPGRIVVTTVMANLGFRTAMADAGIEVIEAKVGDRYVLEEMLSRSAVLGGEQSGHVIFRDLATTGDGVLTGLQLLDLVARRAVSLADLADESMTSLPQVLRNVAVATRGLDVGPAIAAEVAAVEAELGERGRVLIRPSGTEPLIRVMVEAPTAGEAETAAGELVAAVEALAG